MMMHLSNERTGAQTTTTTTVPEFWTIFSRLFEANSRGNKRDADLTTEDVQK
jgi:hypothetical protein